MQYIKNVLYFLYNCWKSAIITGIPSKISILAIVFFFFIGNLKLTAQNNDFEAGFFNMAIGGVIGGAGAVINKKPEQKFGKTLLYGFGKGALGGYLVFESERLVREFAQSGDYNYVWPSKIFNSAGTSIIENAAANRDLWERWHLNIGFNRIEVNTKDNFRLSYRIMPLSLLLTGYAASKGKLDFKTSLSVGSFVFRTNSIDGENGLYGQAPGNSILILDGISGNLALPHEIIHTYQAERLSGFNSLMMKTETSIARKLNLPKTYNLYSKIFYTDYNLVLTSLLYTVADSNGYDRNFFEKEAEYYTDNTIRTKILRINR